MTMSGRIGAFITSGSATVGAASVAISPSRACTVTRGLAAAAMAVGEERQRVSELSLRRVLLRVPNNFIRGLEPLRILGHDK